MCLTVNFVKFRNSIGEFMDTQYNCCSVELGALIYSFIHCIITGVGSLAGLVWFLGHIFWYFILGHSSAWSQHRDLLFLGFAAGTMGISLVSLVFGVILARGILTKRPSFIRAYFIFGVVVIVICLTIAIAFIAAVDKYVVCAAVLVGASFVFAAILWMIWVTYRKFQSNSQFYHKNFLQNPITSTL